MSNRLIVCSDLDDTLRDSRSRHHLSPWVTGLHGKWSDYHIAASPDEPELPAATALRLLAPYYDIHIVSAVTQNAEHQVAEWLRAHRIPWAQIACLGSRNYQPGATSATLKRDYVQKLRAAGRQVALFFEDLPSVVTEISSLGVPVIQSRAVCEKPCAHCAEAD